MAAEDSTFLPPEHSVDLTKQLAWNGRIAHLLPPEHSVNHNSSRLAWQRRDGTPFFHQGIL
jgi:hypothetical protein